MVQEKKEKAQQDLLANYTFLIDIVYFLPLLSNNKRNKIMKGKREK